MGLFSSESSFLGIDFDDKSIKIVELAQAQGRPKLITYGFLDFDVERGAQPIVEASQLAPQIEAICQKAKTKSKKVVASLPAFSVFNSIITLPPVHKDQLIPQIEAEAKKVIPQAFIDSVLDWKEISSYLVASTSAPSAGAKDDNSSEKKFFKITKSQSGNRKYLLTAVSRKLVMQRQVTIKQAGLSLLGLESDTFALIRSLIGRDQANIMIVDISALVTNILIISSGIPVMKQTMNFGGMTITTALAKSLKITLTRAEQFKYDIGVGTAQGGESRIPQLVIELIKPLVEELRYILNQFKETNRQKIEKIILTGGSSLLINLPLYLAKQLDYKVYLGDPWARVQYPPELKPVLEEIGPRFATAVGLVMGMLPHQEKGYIDLRMNYLKPQPKVKGGEAKGEEAKQE